MWYILRFCTESKFYFFLQLGVLVVKATDSNRYFSTSTEPAMIDEHGKRPYIWNFFWQSGNSMRYLLTNISIGVVTSFRNRVTRDQRMTSSAGERCARVCNISRTYTGTHKQPMFLYQRNGDEHTSTEDVV